MLAREGNDDNGKILQSGYPASGYQVVAIRSGRIVFEESLGDDGLGRPITRSTAVPIYCISRVVVGLALCVLQAEDRISLNEVLGDCGMDVDRSLHDIDLASLLDHSAALVAPPAMVGIIAHAINGEKMLGFLEGPGPDVGMSDRTGYSEFAGGYLLQEYLNRRVPGSVLDVLREPLMGCVSVDALLALEVDWYEKWKGLELGCSVANGSGGKRALIIENTEAFARHYLATGGIYSTMVQLAELFYGIGSSAYGAEASGGILAEAARIQSASRGLKDDIALKRRCGFGLGVMTDLESHNFGRMLGKRSFGALGLMGTTFALYDPDLDLAIAAHRSDYDTTGDGHIAWRQGTISRVLDSPMIRRKRQCL